ncbi:hypothetical protein ASA1KI_32720 [Opitutales bacterium ASA1]|uniref:hypothetical protein n=1 Tax=Congregicoccus parvus TaxID=3081749 RepID=UPI002B29C1E8|nr:hypothetical protein ASA1KI_32720 [Opitutales bacterium ASA1]
MTPESIVNEVADSADDLLGDARSMTEARAAIREYLAANHPGLDKLQNEQVVAGVLAILDEEGFFETRSDRSSWNEDEVDAEE